jgi:hypothetical protein
MAGRKTKLTIETIEKAAKLIALGNTQDATSKYLGIHPCTFIDWMNRGEEDSRNNKKTIFAQFSEAIKKAEGVAEVNHVANIITEAKKGNWTASAWWLERRRAKDWKLKTQTDIGNADNQPFKTEDSEKIKHLEAQVKELEQLKAEDE